MFRRGTEVIRRLREAPLREGRHSHTMLVRPFRLDLRDPPVDFRTRVLNTEPVRHRPLSYVATEFDWLLPSLLACLPLATVRAVLDELLHPVMSPEELRSFWQE